MALPAYVALKTIALQRLSLFDYFVSLSHNYCNLYSTLFIIKHVHIDNYSEYKLNCFRR